MIGFRVCFTPCLLLAAAPTAAVAESGLGAWYQMPGSRTACGERMNPDDRTAAHKTLPCGTRVSVQNRRTGKAVVVRINDRGPFAGGRVIDLTRGAAEQIGMVRSGVARVKVTVVGGSGKLASNCS